VIQKQESSQIADRQRNKAKMDNLNRNVAWKSEIVSEKVAHDGWSLGTQYALSSYFVLSPVCTHKLDTKIIHTRAAQQPGKVYMRKNEKILQQTEVRLYFDLLILTRFYGDSEWVSCEFQNIFDLHLLLLLKYKKDEFAGNINEENIKIIPADIASISSSSSS